MANAPPIMNSSDLQLLLRDVYETTYGIHNHTHETEMDALSLVAMREVEDSTSGGLLYERIRQYRAREIEKYFKLSLLEFLDLPTDVLTYLLDLCLVEQQKDSRVASSVKNELDQLMSGENG